MDVIEKKCSKCQKNKNIDAFFWKNKAKGWRHSQCKDCYRNCRNPQEQYIKRKKEYLIRANNRRIKKQTENRIKLLEYFKTHHCINCGENNPIVLDFDHRDHKDKKYHISRMISTYNWETIISEIEKCDVLCSNCHRIRTSKQFGWWYESVN
jgi:hypothetical protein